MEVLIYEAKRLCRLRFEEQNPSVFLIIAPNEYIVKRNLIAFSNSIAKSVVDFPQDFAVYLLGELDNEKPSIKGLDQAEMMFSMTEVIDYVRNHQEEAA